MSNYKTPEEEIIKLRSDLDKMEQISHDQRREIGNLKVERSEYQEEIQILKLEKITIAEQHSTQVKDLKELISLMDASHSEVLGNLEQKVSSKDELNTALKIRLEHLEKSYQIKQSCLEDNTVEDVKARQLDFEEQRSVLCQKLQESEEEKAALRSLTQRLEQELEEYKESLNIKRQELAETNVLKQNLNDEVVGLKLELENIKNQPLSAQSRGNSLFCEVDDRRLQLQQNMKSMKKRYLEMRDENSALTKQLKTLRTENRTLVSKLGEAIQKQGEDAERISELCEKKIKTLTDVIESFKNEAKSNRVTGTGFEEISCFESMLLLKKEENDKLRMKISSDSLAITMLSRDLAEANRKVRWRELEEQELKMKIEDLKGKIAELEETVLKENVEPEVNAVAEVKLPKSIVKSTGDSSENAEKGIEGGSRKVAFSADTVDPHVADRPRRKGAKIISVKPVKFCDEHGHCN